MKLFRSEKANLIKLSKHKFNSASSKYPCELNSEADCFSNDVSGGWVKPESLNNFPKALDPVLGVLRTWTDELNRMPKSYLSHIMRG
jgi:hypothetical protein